jgi:hypothetical protein
VQIFIIVFLFTSEWEMHLKTKAIALEQDIFCSDASSGIQLVRVTRIFFSFQVHGRLGSPRKLIA